MLNYLFFSVNTLKYLVESNLFVFSHLFKSRFPDNRFNFFHVNKINIYKKVESNLFVFSHRFLINGLNLFLDIIIPLFYKY